MIVYIDMDDVLCDFSGAHAKDLKNNPGVKFPQSQYGFYQNLIPIEGAIETVNALIGSPTHTPYILTAPSTRNPFSYTEKRVWVEDKFGYDFVERLIICSNKGLLKGDVLIDDHVEGRGQEGFTGQLLHYGCEAYPNWNAVRKTLGI
jgi:5'-nucleotidase